MNSITDFFQTAGIYLLAFMGISLLLAGILFFVVIRQLQRIQVPEGATFHQTLLLTPFLVVVFLDLLDFALDILSAPLAWMLLDKLGLTALRNVATIEALIPFTQPIPTLTLLWVAARLITF